MITKAVTEIDELEGISILNHKNHKNSISAEEKISEGFVSWEYDIELLKKMNAIAPSVIARENEIITGYALTAFKEAALFHKELSLLIEKIDPVLYEGRPLSSYRYYLMGQICIDKSYRGMGLVEKLYHLHRELYGRQFDFIATTIATDNTRSVKAHERIGFKEIQKVEDHFGQWVLVVWDWRK